MGYGSEHSYNLVMIGHFADETKARSTEQKLERLKEVVETELPDVGWGADKRLGTRLATILDEMKIWGLSRDDLENFAFDHTVRRNRDQITIETDEGEVQGFLKLLIDGGARIEVYSAHEWTSEGTPRAEEAEAAPEESTDDEPR
jgi:Family of unknown function (DUF6375)